MVPVDKATATSYRLSKVTTFLSAAQRFGCNSECNIAACSRHPPYRRHIPMLIVAFDKTVSPWREYDCIVTLGNCFLSATWSRTLAFGYIRDSLRSAHLSNSLDSYFLRRRLHSCMTTDIGWSGRFWSALGLYFLLALNILVSIKRLIKKL